jgi:hypothetical protein
MILRTRAAGSSTWRADAVWAIVTILVSLGIAVWVLDLVRWVPGTPLSLEGDGTFVAMQLRDLDDHGWYWHNQDLGFPFGQNGSLFPELNVLHMAIVKVLGLFYSDPYSPGVVYFVAGFPLAALTMFVLARSQRIDRRAATVIGILFAVAPGHQERFGHLWLASYWTVPIAIWLVLRVMNGPSEDFPGAPERRLISRDTALMAAAAVIVGLSGVYYVAFTMILLLVATIARRLSGGARDWLPGVTAMAALAATAMVPLLLARYGAKASTVTADATTQRSPGESELFAGKAMDLILPWEGHRVEALAYLTSAYKAIQPATVESAALGVVTLGGCIALVVVVIRALTTSGEAARPLRSWALLGGTSLAFYTIGGMGSFVAVFFTPQVRTWSRLSLFIMVFGLLAVGWWLTRLLRGSRPVLGGLVSVLILAVGVLDQTNPARAPDHAQLAAEMREASNYTTSLQEAVGPECGVFQLPVVKFPESAGTERMNGYDQLIPYLASSGLSWSSGVMRGTAEADWQLAADLDDLDGWSRDLAAAGFCAVEVNTNGFDSTSDPRGRLQAVLGAPIAQTADGVSVAYRLPRPQSADRTVLEPVVVSLEGHEIRLVDGVPHQWVGPRTTLRAVNLSERDAELIVTLKIQVLGNAQREVVLRDDQGKILEKFDASESQPRFVSFTMLARPGSTAFELSLSGEPTQLRDSRRSVFGELSDLRVDAPSGGRALSLQQQVAKGVVVP